MWRCGKPRGFGLVYGLAAVGLCGEEVMSRSASGWVSNHGCWAMAQHGRFSDIGGSGAHGDIPSVNDIMVHVFDPSPWRW